MPKNTVNSKLRHGVYIMLVSILIGANLATIALMWASCLSTLLDPAIHPRLSQAGLLFPVFLGIDLLFLLVWVIVSWRWILLPVVGILGCWNYTKDFCPTNWFKETPETNYYKVLSFNVAGFANDEENDFDGWKTLDYITNSDADIIFLQECPGSGTIYSRMKHKMDSLGYDVRSDGGIRIFSKWPLIGETIHTNVSYHGNGSYACLAKIEGDTILLINNHLQSNAISQQEKNDYGNAIEQYDKDKMTASSRILFSRLTEAAAKRAEQTNMLCKLIKEYDKYSMIVGGDFNDTPISYTFQQISNLLNNAFTESGNGMGISFNRKGFPVRIDHIFTSRDLKTHDTFIDNEIKSSDHRPILSRVYKSAK